MNVQVLADSKSMGTAAAKQAAEGLRDVLRRKGSARIIAATGASQFEFLEALTSSRDIQWECVELFHLDEYVGLPGTHPASFRKYLRERLIEKTGILKYHLLEGDGDIQSTIQHVGKEVSSAPIDIAFVGIGENCHLAFNDPPADFENDNPYIVVELDEQCRQQQVHEGWFASVGEVPKRAISMSVRQIMKSREILTIVSGRHKARAVQACLENKVTPLIPASILQTHAHTTIYLDLESAALLNSPMSPSH